MASNTEEYPVECPFCKIAEAYPAASRYPSYGVKELKECVPDETDSTRVDPNCHLVVSAPEVIAFLDILPMTPGHLLITTRRHHVRIGDVPCDEAKDIGTEIVDCL
jgi:diadenosine tetraphosphate (Ap4A) HIT family hydrolase